MQHQHTSELLIESHEATRTAVHTNGEKDRPLTPLEEDRRFFEMVGRAVTQWQHVESLLFRIFDRVIGPVDSDVLSAAFHAVSTLTARLNMTTEALKYAYGDTEVFKKWQALRSRIEACSKERNRLAHFSVVYAAAGEDRSARPQLRPNPNDARKYNSQHEARSLEHIENILNSFVELGRTVDAFVIVIPQPEPKWYGRH